MRYTSAILGLSAAVVQAQNGYKGFNYGATFTNGAAVQYTDFAYEFNKAQNLPGTSGWTAARLYTNIQSGTTADPISAFQAAIDTKTKLLLGLWASAGQADMDNEIAALKTAISTLGTAFTDLVIGISVGSEDLYRITPTALSNDPTSVGTQPDTLISYIKQVRAAIAGTSLASAPVGHVDTYTAFINGSNAEVISNLDFIGMDAYPYWQTSSADNSIGNANATFYEAYQETVAMSQGKPIWVTETGWPVEGPTEAKAVASADNARIYWQDVACSLVQANINTFWYDLQESQWGTASPDFGIYGAGDLGQLSPRYELSC